MTMKKAMTISSCDSPKGSCLFCFDLFAWRRDEVSDIQRVDTFIS
jgi:hypothetical protein